MIDHYSKMDQTLNTKYSNENQNNIRPLLSPTGDIPSDSKVYVQKIDYTLPFNETFKGENWLESKSYPDTKTICGMIHC